MSSSIFKDLVQAELQYKHLKISRITAEDKLNQASLREQRTKKEIVQAESELGKSVPSANAQVETSLAKLLTELNIQLRQQQCLQEAMKGEAQFLAQEAAKLKLEIEMLHSKLRSSYGTAIVTTPRGKMNNNINSSSATAGTSTEFQTAIVTMIGEIAAIYQILHQSSANTSSENTNNESSSSLAQQHHPLVPFLPNSEEVPSFSSWDNRAAAMASSLKKQLAQTHQQLVSSLNVICNSCTNLSDDKEMWSSFVDMVAGAFFDACETILSSGLKHVLAVLHGKKRPRELFAISAKLNQTCQVVFSPSSTEIGSALRNALVDRWINDVFKLPYLHSVLTKKAEIKDKNMSAKPFNETLAKKMSVKYLELDNFIERFEADIELAHKDIVGEYGFAFSPDIVNLKSAQLFNTQLKLESSFQDRFPLAHGGLQVNCSAILDTAIQLLVQQRKKAKEIEKTKRIQGWTAENDPNNYSTLESCASAPPASLVPTCRSQQDDDLEKLLKRIPSITSKNAVIASPFLPEIWNRVAAPESTPTVIVPLEPVAARPAGTPPPHAARARAFRDSSTPTETPTSANTGSYVSVAAATAADDERHDQVAKKLSDVNEKAEEEEDEDVKLEHKRREAREAAERLSNQMKQSAGFFSGGISNAGVKSTTTRNSSQSQPRNESEQQEKDTTIEVNVTRKIPPLHPNSGRRPSDMIINNNNNSSENINNGNNGGIVRPSTGPISKSSRLPESDAIIENNNIGTASLVPQSLTPQEKANKNRILSHPRVIGRDDGSPSSSPDPSPIKSLLSNNTNNTNDDDHQAIGFIKQPYQYGTTFNTVKTNNNNNSQRKSPTPPISNEIGRPQRAPAAPRLINNNTPSSASSSSSPVRGHDNNKSTNTGSNDDELEFLRKREQENYDRLFAAKNNNHQLVGAYGVVAPSPQSARNFVVEKEIVDPYSKEMIEKMQNNPRPSNSAPSAGQQQQSTNNSILQRPKLSTFTQMQQENNNNNNQYANNNSSMLPSLSNNTNNNKSQRLLASSSEPSIHQQRAEREFARREAETMARRQEMQKQIEEEQLEKELARKLKSIEKSSDAKNQDLIRASSREGGARSGGGNNNYNNNNIGGGLDLLPPLSYSTSNSNNNTNNRHSVMNAAGGISANGNTGYYKNTSSSSLPRPGSGRATSTNNNNNSIRPGSATPYTLSPEKVNSSSIGASTALQGTPSSALRRKLSLPQQQQISGTPLASTTPFSSASPSFSLPPAAASTMIIVEPHEASSLSHLEIYKLACSRLSIKPNSGVVRMLPKNPGEHVTTINLDTNYIGNKGFLPLLQVLRVNKGLRFLNLRDNNLESPQISQLCDVLLSGPAGDSLSQINLSNNPITPAGASSLAELIQRRPNLTSVTIKDTLIQGKSAEQIAELCLRNSLRKEGEEL